MLYTKIDKLIADAMKKRKGSDDPRLETLKMIKATLVKAEKDGTEINEISEGKILTKMVAQSKDAIEQFMKGGRKDLADKESAQLEVLEEFAPKVASEDDVRKLACQLCCEFKELNGLVSMKDMKIILAKVQETYPTANGKIVSEVVKNYK